MERRLPEVVTTGGLEDLAVKFGEGGELLVDRDLRVEFDRERCQDLAKSSRA